MSDKLGMRARAREIEVLKCFEKKKETLSPSNFLTLSRHNVERLTEIGIHEIATVFSDLRAAGYIEVTPGYEMASAWIYELTEAGQMLLDTLVEVKQPKELESAESLFAYMSEYHDPNTHHWMSFNMTQYREEHRARFFLLLEKLCNQGRIAYKKYGRSWSVDIIDDDK